MAALAENGASGVGKRLAKLPRLEYLRDGKGIYAISIDPVGRHNGATTLALRPDKLGMTTAPQSCKHIPPLLLHKSPLRVFPFTKHTVERTLVDHLAHRMHIGAGLCDDNGERLGEDECGTTDTPRSDENRRKYFGLKRSAWRITNYMIGVLIEEAADHDALMLARRFIPSCRRQMYEVASTSSRMRQLIETFPALGLHLSTNPNLQAARGLVERGARLPAVAESVGMEMAFKKAPPGVAAEVLDAHELIADRPDLIHAYMPTATPRARRWLRAIRTAGRIGGPMIEWTARNASALGDRIDDVVLAVEDVNDWVRTSYAASIPPHILKALGVPSNLWQANDAADLITRQFSPDMSLTTVRDLSLAWHEAVARSMPSNQQPFPEPWCDGDKVNGFTITPITNVGDLYLEGKAMHHCVATCADGVAAGLRYIFSVTENDKHVATAEILPHGDTARLGQVRGPCNKVVAKPIMATLRRWLKTRPAITVPRSRRGTDHSAWFDVGRGGHDMLNPWRIYDDDIPF
jgi:hypothetical protein